MKSSAKNVKLTPVDELFSTEESRQGAALEKVQIIPLAELYPFPNHPFAVRDDDSMKETVESVREYGVLVPAIARPREGGGYELISGHRRKHACELAGLGTMPVIVRDMDDDTAIIYMVDSNLQRENILPSEKAKAHKMKMDAIRRKAGRPAKDHQVLDDDNNSRQLGENLLSVEIVGREAGESARQVHRYIRLTELSPPLQKMVDDKKIAMTPAVEISYLKPEEQALLVETIDSEQATPSLSQAQRMKKLSQSGELNEDTMLTIMSEEKSRPGRILPSPAKSSASIFPVPIRPGRWRIPSSSCWKAGKGNASGALTVNKIFGHAGQDFPAPAFLLSGEGEFLYINTFQCRRGHSRDGPADLTVMETAPCGPHTSIRRFYGSLYLNAEHRQRMETLQKRMGCRRGRDTPAYYAAMYLLTSNESLCRHTANCFYRYGIEFAYATLRDMSPHDYTLFSAAKDIYTDTPGMALADLANSVVVDTLAFSLISNAVLIARYGRAVLDIRERGNRT